MTTVEDSVLCVEMCALESQEEDTRSNSLCFFVTHTPTHVSIEFYTFRCLVGHVFQKSGPVGRNVCGTMINMSQVTLVLISPDFIWNLEDPHSWSHYTST